MNNFKKINENNKPECGVEVIGFSPNWIDEDFNPNGTRACFLLDDDTWISARWLDYHDSYIQDNKTYPTHYMDIPKTNKLM